MRINVCPCSGTDSSCLSFNKQKYAPIDFYWRGKQIHSTQHNNDIRSIDTNMHTLSCTALTNDLFALRYSSKFPFGTNSKTRANGSCVEQQPIMFTT